MCQYLYAAFSMKDREDEGLTAGAARGDAALAARAHPHRRAGDAPPRARAEPADRRRCGIRVRTAELPAPAARLSRRHPDGAPPVRRDRRSATSSTSSDPEGLDMADQDALAAVEKAAPLPRGDEDEIGPRLQDFDTIGDAVPGDRDRVRPSRRAAGRGAPVRRVRRPRRRRRASSGSRSSCAVTDLASAHAAIDTIVEQGEGARGDWREAHFGRLITVLDEYLDLRDADPSFEPARPVLAACVREREDGLAVPADHRPVHQPGGRPAERGLRGASSSSSPATSPTPTRPTTSSTSSRRWRSGSCATS